MISDENKSAAVAAANWWVEKMKFPKFNNGDRSPASGLASALAMLNTRDVKTEEAESFKNILTKKILDRMENGDKRIIIECDYHPNTILFEACKESGVSPNNAPWKTCMNIEDGRYIHIKSGYGSSFESLYY